MTGAERGWLLLGSRLGNPERKCLTPAQIRRLTNRMSGEVKGEGDRELSLQDLLAFGCTREEGIRILALLDETELLEYYLGEAARKGCIPLTRVTAGYPGELKVKLGGDAPACLWARGDLTLLEKKKIALAGSRALLADNEAFAREVGKQAALQGYALVSGNARGADRTAQEAALAAGGQVICVLPGSLVERSPEEKVLYLSLDGFDMPFTPYRALERNRILHALGEKVFIAQTTLEKGGTWAGCEDNLKHGFSPVFCYDDGTQAIEALVSMGAERVSMEALGNMGELCAQQISFL